MKISHLLSYCVLFALSLSLVSCNDANKSSSSNFGSYEITLVNTNNTLPVLQSYALGIDSAGNWILIGGRHNGLHNFSTPAFPDNLANHTIYKINPQTWAVDSFDLSNLLFKGLNPIKNLWISAQFSATNIQHTQSGNYLYLCGGYGAIPNPLAPILKLPYDYITYGIVSRVDLNKLSQSISAKDANGVLSSVLLDTCDNFKVTGGEMFRMADGSFYLVVGHRFDGEYGNINDSTKPQPFQDYTRRIWKFTVNESASSFSINKSTIVSIPNTPDPDPTSLLRRRDLVVVPSVYSGNQLGIAIYGGVFTYSGPQPGDGSPNVWQNPVYINTGSTPSYVVDSNYIQISNNYSAANVLMFSQSLNTMYTSILGGLVDKYLDTNTSNGNPASWTKDLLTIARTPAGNAYQSTAIYDPIGMPIRMGAEAQFIPLNGLNSQWYYNDNYNIFNYDSLPTGGNILGYIYGGITCDSTQSSSTKPANATNAVYQVKFIKP